MTAARRPHRHTGAHGVGWAEAVTRLADGHVPDAIHHDVRRHFDEQSLASLTFVVTTINAWNRLAVASRLPPGAYQPGKKPA